MTIQIPLSQVGSVDAFATRVAAFRRAKLDHHNTTGEPAPREHDLVEAVVRRVPCFEVHDDYIIEPYEIFDDRVPLRSRKDRLIAEVAADERALMDASLPPGKRRLAGLQVADICQKPEAERSDADRQFLEAEAARLTREAAIGRHAAELQAAIEDLTETTIDAWQMTPFPAA